VYYKTRQAFHRPSHGTRVADRVGTIFDDTWNSKVGSGVLALNIIKVSQRYTVRSGIDFVIGRWVRFPTVIGRPVSKIDVHQCFQLGLKYIYTVNSLIRVMSAAKRIGHHQTTLPSSLLLSTAVSKP
jgi:hypothetical protein